MKSFIGPRTKDRKILSHWASRSPEAIERSRKNYAPRRKQLNLEIKLHVLSYYGPSGKLQCSCKNCQVIDPDMLTIDHTNNDGAIDRKSLGGKEIYRRLVSRNYPEGFQTLCWNHQWKKEMMRRRGEL
jgi:hypothetical protein